MKPSYTNINTLLTTFSIMLINFEQNGSYHTPTIEQTTQIPLRILHQAFYESHNWTSKMGLRGFNFNDCCDMTSRFSPIEKLCMSARNVMGVIPCCQVVWPWSLLWSKTFALLSTSYSCHTYVLYRYYNGSVVHKSNYNITGSCCWCKQYQASVV